MMNQTQACPRCGCSTYHLNKKMRLVCDLCGTPIDQFDDAKKQMEDSRKYAKAIAHLEAGNWPTASDLFRQLAADHPLEVRLYHLILKAETHDFQDLDPCGKGYASGVWEKLVRFNAVTDEMRNYAENVYESRRDNYAEQKVPLLTYIFLAAGIAFVTAILFAFRRWFWAIVSGAFLIAAVDAISKENPKSVAKRRVLKPDSWDENPFKIEK